MAKEGMTLLSPSAMVYCRSFRLKPEALAADTRQWNYMPTDAEFDICVATNTPMGVYLNNKERPETHTCGWAYQTDCPVCGLFRKKQTDIVLPVLRVTLLPGCERYAEDIKVFMDAQVWKLHKNRHKGHWDGITPAEAYRKLEIEVRELHEAMRTGNTFHMMEECADVANFALILASALVRDVARGMQEGHEDVASKRGEPVQGQPGTE